MDDINWLSHPVALAARGWWQRRQAAEPAYTVDDAHQAGAIRAWMHSERGCLDLVGGLAQRAGRAAVVDDLRARFGRLAPPVQWRSAPEDHADPATEITPERIVAARQALRRLLAMPAVWQRVALGVLQGDSYEAIGLSLDPPVTASRVCQMVRQIRAWVDRGKEPLRPQLAETADTEARPQTHAVRAMHALDAVHARSALSTAIFDPSIGDIRAAAAVRAAAAAEMYRRAFGDDFLK